MTEPRCFTARVPLPRFASSGATGVRSRAARAGAAAAAAVALVLTGCAAPAAAPDPDSGAAAEPREETAPDRSGDVDRPRQDSQRPQTSEAPELEPTWSRGQRAALAATAALRVKGRAPMTGYDRDRFGPAWLDADRNGCDTRNDILRRDLRRLALAIGTNGCVVDAGVLRDPFTGARISFVRGDGFLVDIDHVVALGNSWSAGAGRWGIAKRAALANDPLNLLAVDAGENRSKGDGDAATWLPPNRSFRCAYVARQVAVKSKYDLAVTAAEQHVMVRVLTSCPDVRLPRDSGAPVRVDQNVTDPGVDPPPAQGSAPGGGSPADPGNVYYENCDAARAAGGAPVRAGQPGYGSHLDRDGDGTGCED